MRAIRCLFVMVVVLALASVACAQGGGARDGVAPRAAAGGYGGMGGGGGYGGPAPSGSLGVPKHSIVELDHRISWLQSQMKQVEIGFAAAETRLANAKKRAESGLAPTSELRTAEVEVALQREQFDQLQREMATMQRLKTLATPIEISLKSSPIRQAAEIVGRASKLSVSVDPKVPQDLKVNAEAQNVPLGSVLEVLANAAGLIIAPTSDAGLLLRLPGKLVVEGVTYTTDADGAPWADDWGLMGTRGLPVGRRWLGLLHDIPFTPPVGGMGMPVPGDGVRPAPKGAVPPKADAPKPAPAPGGGGGG